MRTFEHPNKLRGWKCPICSKNDDKPVVLVSILGTEEENICQANQYHIDCIELTEKTANGVTLLSQCFRKREEADVR